MERTIPGERDLRKQRKNTSQKKKTYVKEVSKIPYRNTPQETYHDIQTCENSARDHKREC